jgi:hypothetical protein
VHTTCWFMKTKEEFKEIQRDGEGVDWQFCPWAVCRHHQTARYRMLGMGEKRERKEIQMKESRKRHKWPPQFIANWLVYHAIFLNMCACRVN